MRYTYIADPRSAVHMVVHRAIGSTRDYKTITLLYYSSGKVAVYPIDFTSKDGILYSYFRDNDCMFLPETHEYFNARVMLDGVKAVGGDRFGIHGPLRRKMRTICLAVKREYKEGIK